MIKLRSIQAVIVFFMIVVNQTSLMAEEAWDPIEGWNRKVFWFNEHFDQYLLGPVADGYDYVLPEVIQDGVGNVFSNLEYPVELLSDIIQLKFDQALSHTGRFLLNSTFGIGGFFDVAQHLGLEEHNEDLGTALAYYGVPAGPYLVLPFIGPSNIREGLSLAVDSALDPVYWIAYGTASDSDAFLISGGSTALKTIDMRASLTEAIESGREASLDYYLFVRSAYYQYRTGLTNDGELSDDELFNDEYDDL